MSEETKQPAEETPEEPQEAPQEEAPPAEEKVPDEKAEKAARGKKKKEKTYTLTREQMEAAELAARQLESVKDQFVRLTAEYDNYRKRTAKEKDNLYQDAKADTIKEFLAVYDNLELAAGGSAAGGPACDAFRRSGDGTEPAGVRGGAGAYARRPHRSCGAAPAAGRAPEQARHRHSPGRRGAVRTAGGRVRPVYRLLPA